MIRVPAFLVLTAAIYVALNLAIDHVIAWMDTPPIRILHGHVVDDGKIVSGGQIRVVLGVERNRLCHTVVARYVHSPAGDVVAYQESIGGDAPLGPSRYAFTFPIPPVPPGRYSFKGVVNSSCGDRRYVEATPSLPFVVQ